MRWSSLSSAARPPCGVRRCKRMSAAGVPQCVLSLALTASTVICAADARCYSAGSCQIPQGTQVLCKGYIMQRKPVLLPAAPAALAESPTSCSLCMCLPSSARPSQTGTLHCTHGSHVEVQTQLHKLGPQVAVRDMQPHG